MLSTKELLAEPLGRPALTAQSDVLLEQTELIGLRELHALALTLQRRKHERHCMLGRALAKAVHGEVWAEKGSREKTLFELAGEIIEAHPFCSPRSVVPFFEAAISNAQANHQSKCTAEKFLKQLEYHQARKQGKAETLRTLEGTLLGQAPIGALELPPGAPIPQGQRSQLDIIVRADGVYYLRHPQQDVYALRLKDDPALKLELRRQFGDSNTVLNLIDTVGRPYPVENIMAWYGCNAHTVQKTFAIDGTRFEFNTATLSIGHSMLSPALAAFDDATHAWLTELAGGAEHVEQLYEWIAATDQRHIEKTAAAIAVVAKADTGKSLFARLLAMTWDSRNAVKLSNAVQQFNGSLQLCPIWHADEEMPKDLTGHDFRDLVASTDRLIEPKGKEKMQLIGAPRIVITVNEIDDIRLRGANGPDAVKAIADRFAIFYPTSRTSEALARLRLPGRQAVDKERMTRHLRWIQCEIAPSEQRFLGAQHGDSTEAELPILQAAMQLLPQLFELLESYLAEPNDLEKTYHTEDRQFSTGGQRFPVMTQSGDIYVRPTELGKLLNIDPTRIEYSLRPFLDGKESRQFCFGSYRGRYRRLNLDRLISATGADVEQACNTVSVDTRGRHPRFA